MNKLTVKDLHRMKAEGKKIAAAVVYDYQVARICQFAGANLLSVGDSHLDVSNTSGRTI